MMINMVISVEILQNVWRMFIIPPKNIEKIRNNNRINRVISDRNFSKKLQKSEVPPTNFDKNDKKKRKNHQIFENYVAWPIFLSCFITDPPLFFF